MPQSHCFESRVSLQFEHLLKHLLKVCKLISHMHYVGETFRSFKRQYTRPQEGKKKKIIGEDWRCKNKCVGFNIKGGPYQGHQKILPYVFSSYIFDCITHTKSSYFCLITMSLGYDESSQKHADSEKIYVSFQELLGSCKGFPGGASGKEPTCQCRRHKRRRVNSWVKKVLWRRATHSSIFAWRIPWTEEPGGLQSMGS